MKNRLPMHVGFIPDGNRRWATARGMGKEAGYAHGIAPGLMLMDACKALGIPEISVYGFTQDNTKRPNIQKQAFRTACIEFAHAALEWGAALLVVGDEASTQFPADLVRFRNRQGDAQSSRRRAESESTGELWLGVGYRGLTAVGVFTFAGGFPCGSGSTLGRRPSFERLFTDTKCVCRFFCD
jgi:hypothetical protein